jgi:hypothetical protein
VSIWIFCCPPEFIRPSGRKSGRKAKTFWNSCRLMSVILRVMRVFLLKNRYYLSRWTTRFDVQRIPSLISGKTKRSWGKNPYTNSRLVYLGAFTAMCKILCVLLVCFIGFAIDGQHVLDSTQSIEYGVIVLVSTADDSKRSYTMILCSPI